MLTTSGYTSGDPQRGAFGTWITVTHFAQRTAPERQVREILVEGFNDVVVVLEGGNQISVPKHFLNLPRTEDKKKLAEYVKASCFAITELSDGTYKVTSHVRGLGGGLSCSKSSRVTPVESSASGSSSDTRTGERNEISRNPPSQMMQQGAPVVKQQPVVKATYKGELHKAVSALDIERVKKVINTKVGKDFSIDVKDQSGRTPLDVLNTNIGLKNFGSGKDLLFEILKHGADPTLVNDKSKLLALLLELDCGLNNLKADPRDKSVIHEATKKLLQAGVNVNTQYKLPKDEEIDKEGFFPIQRALSVELLALLINYGADVNVCDGEGVPLLLQLVSSMCLAAESTRWLGEDIIKNDIEIRFKQIKIVLEAGLCYIDCEFDKETPLDKVLETLYDLRLKNKSRTELAACVDLLLQHGADPFKIKQETCNRLSNEHLLRFEKFRKKNRVSKSPALSNACKTKNKKNVEAAMRAGAQPDAQTLTWAFLTGDMSIVDVVRQAGAEPDHETLNVACLTGDLLIVRKALACGAKMNGKKTEEIAHQAQKTTNNPAFVHLVCNAKAPDLWLQLKTNKSAVLDYDMRKENALNVACRSGDLSALDVAIAKGIKPDRYTLSWAVASNKQAMVVKVQIAGAWPHNDARLPSEMTVACCLCNTRIVDLLIFQSSYLAPNNYILKLANLFVAKGQLSPKFRDMISNSVYEHRKHQAESQGQKVYMFDSEKEELVQDCVEKAERETEAFLNPQWGCIPSDIRLFLEKNK